jgi:transcriptional regulator with XRE-family HTH domain
MNNKNEFQVLLGSNVRKARVSKNWTIERLALESGLTYSLVIRIELGQSNPTAYSLYKIINTLQSNPNEIFNIVKIQ